MTMVLRVLALLPAAGAWTQLRAGNGALTLWSNGGAFFHLVARVASCQGFPTEDWLTGQTS